MLKKFQVTKLCKKMSESWRKIVKIIKGLNKKFGWKNRKFIKNYEIMLKNEVKTGKNEWKLGRKFDKNC